jgi:fluoride ion exporter CrcB/FEX
MILFIGICGAVGALIRAALGSSKYGKKEPLATGIVAIIIGFAFSVFVAGFSPWLAFIESWETAVVAGLIGYVGLDLLSSLLKIIKCRGILV